ncbi:catechol 2,3-dioxygenase [Enterococcus sp. PF1-24]|uniref:VOC family protein n=1 Tax=unclassified Enterococcus TaxID=2608891 RepID=UPI002475B57F|nr:MULTISPECIES: VOC family protein [unclassified Enterococcus]MDH6364571.1 catechol 2,3-dioxygenase [Enterococcus sp. PFB1-1]MDH6401672.1 catechol 2,3-dioxygenase [Enterococcus sp. PF1-24]
MRTFRLDPTAQLELMAIRVKDRDKMIQFYQMLGFHLKREENELAIFGTGEKNSEMLWLEESPRAKAHEGETRKMARFSIVVPTEEEMQAIFLRIKAQNYPLKKVVDNDECLGFLLEDPETNEIEVYYKKEAKQETTNPEKAVATEVANFFSDGVHFGSACLNVADHAEQLTFLKDVLGMSVIDKRQQIVAATQKPFSLCLAEALSCVITATTDKVHGLDFLKLSIEEENFDLLQQHLDELQQAYFVDGKQQILTVYDTVGIEWWFIKRIKD